MAETKETKAPNMRQHYIARPDDAIADFLAMTRIPATMVTFRERVSDYALRVAGENVLRLLRAYGLDIVDKEAPAPFKPTHRHVKSGNLYQVLHRAHDCTNGKDIRPVVVYRDSTGSVWVRYAPEFDDGRFEEIGR